MHLLMYGTDVSLLPPAAMPFDNNLLRQKFHLNLDNILMPVVLDFDGLCDAVKSGSCGAVGNVHS